MKRIIIRILMFAIAIASVVSCSSSKQFSGAEISVLGNSEAASSSNTPVARVDTVVLSCPESVVIGSIGQVYVTDEMYVVVDKAPDPHAYGFSKSGKYLCSYGRRGEAPGEYINLAACAVTPAGEVAIVDSYTHRFLYYDLHNGQFKRQVAFPTGSLDMVQQCVFLSDNTALLARYVFNRKNTAYAEANIAEKRVLPFADVPLKSNNAGIPVGWHAISAYQGRALYIRPFAPVIYQYPDEQWMYINQDKKVYDDEELAAIKDFSISTYVKAMADGHFAGFTDVYELKDCVFLAFLDSEFSLINKHSREMKTYKYEKDDMMIFKNVARIVGAIPERNALIGADTDPLTDTDRLLIYNLTQ